MAKVQVTQATGKRKTSVARAYLTKGTGKLIINNQDLEEYVSSQLLQLKVQEPFLVSGESGYDVKISVFGGGVNSQVDAMRQAIAKALLEVSGNNEELKKKFLDYDRTLLIADTRFKEMKKPNNSHARAKRQKSYR